MSREWCDAGEPKGEGKVVGHGNASLAEKESNLLKRGRINVNAAEKMKKYATAILANRADLRHPFFCSTTQDWVRLA